MLSLPLSLLIFLNFLLVGLKNYDLWIYGMEWGREVKRGKWVGVGHISVMGTFPFKMPFFFPSFFMFSYKRFGPSAFLSTTTIYIHTYIYISPPIPHITTSDLSLSKSHLVSHACTSRIFDKHIYTFSETTSFMLPFWRLNYKLGFLNFW